LKKKRPKLNRKTKRKARPKKTPELMVPAEILAVVLSLNMTNDNIAECAKRIGDMHLSHMETEGVPLIVGVVIRGFDGGIPELGRSPEARAFCRRLTSTGFIAAITPTLFSFDPDGALSKQQDAHRPLGAYEVWSIGEGMFCAPGNKTDVGEGWARFAEAMPEAAGKCYAMMTAN
jgi:hypothetical protein